MNIGSFLVADSKATKLIQPGKGFAPLPISSDHGRCHARCCASREQARYRVRAVPCGLTARHDLGRPTHNLGDCAAVRKLPATVERRRRVPAPVESHCDWLQ